MFHMPLFAALSGYLFATSEKRYSVKELLVKRGRRLLIPALVWPALVYIGAYAVHLATGSTMTFRLNSLWFLTALFFCVVVSVLCKKVGQGRLWVYPLAILVSLALPDRFGLAADKFILPYFVAGLLFHRYSARITPKVYGAAWLLSSAAFWILFMHWETDYYLYATHMSFYVRDVGHEFFIVAYRFLGGFVGIIWILGIIYVLRRFFAHFRLAWLGRYTMGIYVLSTQVNLILYRLEIPYTNMLLYDFVISPAVACILCLLAVYSSKLIQRNRLAGIMLLGS
jgi:fucose 4-O-acetylase-like acetyltransferase